MFVAKVVRLLAVLVVIGSLCNSVRADGGGNVETVFLSGFPAPGVPGDVDVLLPNLPGVINQSGEFGIAMSLSGAGVFDRALFGGQPTFPQLIVHESEQAPDLPPGIDLDFLSAPVVGEEGIVGILANLSGPGVGVNNDRAFFVGTASDLQLAMFEGSPAPATSPGVMIGSFFVRAFNATGQFAANAQLIGIGVNASNNEAIIARIDDSLELVARLGDTAPGGGAFSDISDPRILMNDANQILFLATTTMGSGIFQYSNGALEAIAFEGDAAPGTETGTTLNGFDVQNFGINDLGQIAFAANLIDLAGTETQGVFSNASGEFELIAMTGQDAPGIPLSGNFNQFSGLVINGAGDTAFTATLIGLGINDTNNRAVYAEVNDSLRLVARRGFPAAGTAAGVDYDTFTFLSMNESGQLVFNSTLNGNVTEHNDTAIYVASNGYPLLLAREGALFDVDDNPNSVEFRFIEALAQGAGFFGNNSGGQDGLRLPINNAGQVIFHLHFTDDSAGIFVADCSFVLGDVNGDGVVDLLDVAPLIELINAGSELPEADINGDGNVDLLDVSPFVNLLTS